MMQIIGLLAVFQHSCVSKANLVYLLSKLFRKIVSASGNGSTSRCIVSDYYRGWWSRSTLQSQRNYVLTGQGREGCEKMSTG